MGEELVLGEEPPILKVPIFGTVEHKIKPGAGGDPGLIGRAAQRFGDKTGVRMVGFGFV